MGVAIRKITESDRESYISLKKQLTLHSFIYNTEFFRESMWNSFCAEDRLCYAIITGDESVFCGYCAIKKHPSGVPELEIELLREFQNKGIGYIAILLLLKELESTYLIKNCLARIQPENYSSQALMKKLNAVPDGIELDENFDPQNAEAFEFENSSLISGELTETAELFNVDPKKLLTHVLRFNINSSEALKGPLSGKARFRESKRNIEYAKDKFIIINAAKIALEKLNYYEDDTEQIKELKLFLKDD